MGNAIMSTVVEALIIPVEKDFGVFCNQVLISAYLDTGDTSSDSRSQYSQGRR